MTKYYESEYDNKNFDEKLDLATKYEEELKRYLVIECKLFVDITHTGKLHKSYALDKFGIKLPDLMGTHRTGKIIYIDAKRKNRRFLYEDNGIDTELIHHYLRAQELYKADVYVLFKDNPQELEAKMKQETEGGNEIDCRSRFVDKNGNGLWYGNSLNILNRVWKNYPNAKGVDPRTGKKITYFPLTEMELATELFQNIQLTMPDSVMKEFLGGLL